MKKRASKSNTASTGRHLVTFELSPEAFEALQRDAAKHAVRSHHQRAREITLDYLANRDEAELRTTLASIESDLLGLAGLMRRDAYAVLVHAAGWSEEKANKWIREHMRGPVAK